MIKNLLTISLLLYSTGIVYGQQKVTFSTQDNILIDGYLYGESKTALILCHGRGYKTGGKSFNKQCEYFNKQDVMCLAINFRGYPAQKTPVLKPGMGYDILGAVEYLVKKKSAEKVYVLGSSMGGFITLKASSLLKSNPNLAGIIIMSAYGKPDKTFTKPKLFIVAEDDKHYYSKVMATFKSAATPKEMIAYSKGGHGQSLFNAHGEKLLSQIVSFMINNP